MEVAALNHIQLFMEDHLMKTLLLSLSTILFLLGTTGVYAGNHEHDDDSCPLGLVNGMTLDAEFGPGSAEITRCLKKRRHVKLVVQANRFCMDNVPNSQCTRPFALLNLAKMIDDYEITHGMKAGRDYEMVVIAHTAGGPLMLKDESINPFRNKVEALMQRGVKFYLCQNATRAMIKKGLLPPGDATANIIEGVEYVTAGITALVDFQYQGYRYVRP